jgi:hypothetical protein
MMEIEGITNLVTLLGWNDAKRKMPPKRDIVDPFFHASRAFGHKPALGTGFPTTWELESWAQQQNKIIAGSIKLIVGVPSFECH